MRTVIGWVIEKEWDGEDCISEQRELKNKWIEWQKIPKSSVWRCYWFSQNEKKYKHFQNKGQQWGTQSKLCCGYNSPYTRIIS